MSGPMTEGSLGVFKFLVANCDCKSPGGNCNWGCRSVQVLLDEIERLRACQFTPEEWESIRAAIRLKAASVPSELVSQKFSQTV